MSMIFYPGSISTPVDNPMDGMVSRAGVVELFSILRSGVGNSNDYGNSYETHMIAASGSSSYWSTITRKEFLFDTSEIGSAVITGATLRLTCANYYKDDNFTVEQVALALVSCNPKYTDKTDIDDYVNFGSTRYANDIALVNGDIVFTLNATGLATINKTGISKFGVRFACDLDNNEPTWASYSSTYIDIYNRNYNSDSGIWPCLTVTLEGEPVLTSGLFFLNG